MGKELNEALIEADALADVNVIVLAGAGRDFCAGYDLNVYAGNPAINAAEYRTHNSTMEDDCWSTENTARPTLQIFDIHKPVIAKVHGNCMAGGTDLALMCDMVLAAEDARIGFPATRANGTPPTNMWFYHVGPQWAKRMMMTGDSLLGRDAARIGLVLDAYPADKLDAAVNELARRVSLIDNELLAAHKRVINTAMELSGARTLQRMAAELDARAHLSQGPRRKQFRADITGPGGLKLALKNRDEPFGDSVIQMNWPGK
jgi:enoyl-CoA hydratase